MVISIKDKHPGYYEAILQLRDVNQDVYDIVDQEIKKAGIYVSILKKVTNGKDYYLADSKFTKKLGKSLVDTFGGEFKISAKLFTQKDGRDIYRLTVLFRGIHFKKGDLVMYKGDKYTLRVVGKKAMLQNAETGKKVHVGKKDFRFLKQVE